MRIPVNNFIRVNALSCLDHSNFGHCLLFRISDFVLGIFVYRIVKGESFISGLAQKTRFSNPEYIHKGRKINMKMRLKVSTILIALSVVLVSVSFAADYPTKPITLINPMPPGGTLDIQARAFAPVAEKMLGQPVVVVNKTGATGMVGGLAGAQADPDGYTLTVGSVNIPNALEWELANGRKPPFTRHDFVCIGTFTMSPTFIIVPNESPL